MRYIGLDLAWGAKNTTGAVALQWQEGAAGGSRTLAVCAYADALLTDDDILAFVRQADDGGGVLVGIDAPLDVPNLTGERPVEAALRKCFGKYQAGAHPANRQRFKNDIRGERLAKRLKDELNIVNDFRFAAGDETVRRCVEVFPHPAMVVLFGLAKTLKYKAKPGRDTHSRMGEYVRYIEGLQNLAANDPTLTAPDWLAVPHDKSGAALKRYEDLLDALMCAYIAAYFGR